MKTLIGFAGKKRSGKDTAGEHLAKLTGFETYSFADPLKKFCSELFNLPLETFYDDDLKEVKQTFMIYDWQDNLMSILHENFYQYLREGDKYYLDKFYRHVLIPVMMAENSIAQKASLRCSPRYLMQRFGTEFIRNQVESKAWILMADKEYNEKGTLIIKDVRLENEAQWIQENNGVIIRVDREEVNKSIDTHISERSLDKKYISAIVENNGTIEELQNGIEMLLEYNLQSPTLSLNDLL